MDQNLKLKQQHHTLYMNKLKLIQKDQTIMSHQQPHLVSYSFPALNRNIGQHEASSTGIFKVFCCCFFFFRSSCCLFLDIADSFPSIFSRIIHISMLETIKFCFTNVTIYILLIQNDLAIYLHFQQTQKLHLVITVGYFVSLKNTPVFVLLLFKAWFFKIWFVFMCILWWKFKGFCNGFFDNFLLVFLFH